MKSKYKNWAYIKLLILLVIAMPCLTSCEVQDDFKYSPSTGPDTGKFAGTAWEYIEAEHASKELGMLKEAIELAGFQAKYEQAEVRTFIMPRDKAFTAYLKSKGYATLADIPMDELKSILNYHIVKAYYYTADPQFMKKNDPIKYDTEGIDPMFLSHNGNFQVLINENTKQTLTVYISNIRPENGVIHISSAIAFYNPK